MANPNNSDTLLAEIAKEVSYLVCQIEYLFLVRGKDDRVKRHLQVPRSMAMNFAYYRFGGSSCGDVLFRDHEEPWATRTRLIPELDEIGGTAWRCLKMIGELPEQSGDFKITHTLFDQFLRSRLWGGGSIRDWGICEPADDDYDCDDGDSDWEGDDYDCPGVATLHYPDVHALKTLVYWVLANPRLRPGNPARHPLRDGGAAYWPDPAAVAEFAQLFDGGPTVQSGHRPADLKKPRTVRGVDRDLNPLLDRLSELINEGMQKTAAAARKVKRDFNYVSQAQSLLKRLRERNKVTKQGEGILTSL